MTLSFYEPIFNLSFNSSSITGHVHAKLQIIEFSESESKKRNNVCLETAAYSSIYVLSFLKNIYLQVQKSQFQLCRFQLLLVEKHFFNQHSS